MHHFVITEQKTLISVAIKIQKLRYTSKMQPTIADMTEGSKSDITTTMNSRDEFRNVSVTGWPWRACTERLAGRGRHTQPACCQPQAQYRLAYWLLQLTGNQTDGSRGEAPSSIYEHSRTQNTKRFNTYDLQKVSIKRTGSVDYTHSCACTQTTLPDQLRDSDCTESAFQKSLKTFFFNQY